MDLELTCEEREIAATFARVLSRESSSDRVRAAESAGFDERLWSLIAGMNAVGLVAPEDAGGAGAGFVELGLLAESVGKYLACVPVVEAAVAARLLAEVGGHESLVVRAASGDTIVVFSPGGATGSVAQVVPGGVVASAVLTLDDEELVLAVGTPGDALCDFGFVGASSRALDGYGVERIVLATGVEAARLWELGLGWWRLGSASAAAGIALQALDVAAAYAITREQFGSPIGSFQAIQGMLADVAMAADGGLLLAREAAWMHDQGMDSWRAAADVAFAHCAETAVKSAEVCVHVHGGYGFSMEYDAQLYLRRAKSIQLISGDPEHLWARIGSDSMKDGI